MSIADSMYADFNPELTIPYANRLAIFDRYDKNESFDSVFLQLIRLKNNGDRKHQISNCIPESNLLDAFKIKSENLSKRIKTGEFGFEEYEKFLDAFIIYFNNHLSIVRSNNSLNSDYHHLRSIFLPSIQHHANKKPKKAIVLVELLKSMSIKLNLQSQLVNDEKSVINLNHKIQDITSKLHESNDNALYIELGNSIDMLAAYKDSLFKHNPTLYNQKFGFNNITIDDITEPIDQGELMLEYFVNDPVVYVFSVSAQTVKCKTINIKSLKNQLVEKVDLDDSLRKELYNTLLPEDVKEHKKLLIIPDEFLFYLNFEEFITEDGSYLLQDHMV